MCNRQTLLFSYLVLLMHHIHECMLITCHENKMTIIPLHYKAAYTTVYLASNIWLFTASSKFICLTNAHHHLTRMASFFRSIFWVKNREICSTYSREPTKLFIDWKSTETWKERMGQPVRSSGKSIMSFPDGSNFAANMADSGSSQQPFLGTGINSSVYPGFPLPMYLPQFWMALPMMPYPLLVSPGV